MMPAGLPGRLALLGSGETAPAGGRVFEALAQGLPQPLRVAILETPAGFELNSARVAGRVADYIRVRLGNYSPQVAVLPARRRGTPFSPDDDEITRPLLHAGMIFAGPGSPTYAARQLRDSLAWNRIRARHALGAALVFASAATITAGRFSLPVYEIYKAGHDIHWVEGLDLLGPFGLSIVFIPHWNNNDGGAELDTSHCFMGRDRFDALAAMLPLDATIIGLDEHTSLVFDLARAEAHVLGPGRVTIVSAGVERPYADGSTFGLDQLGPFHAADLLTLLPAAVVEEARSAAAAVAAIVPAPDEVLALVAAREVARKAQDWTAADALRGRIEALGWQVQDTPSGPNVMPGGVVR